MIRGAERFSATACLAGGTCLLSLFWIEAQAQAPTFKEYEVKAVFLFNFIQFVEWPGKAFPAADTPLTIGVLGEDPFGDILEQTIQGETIKHRKINLQRSRRFEDLKTCHLLFISKSEEGRLPQILREMAATGALTVGESDHFCRLGGVINFVTEKNKVRFEVCLAAAERSDLKMSAKLLKLAKICCPGRAAEGD